MIHVKDKTFYFILLIFGCYVLLSLPYLTNVHFWVPDADRIAMDGIFLLDFIKDLPGSLLHIYDYTIIYYAKYPALSIGYRPTFFPLAEAFFYYIFGLSNLSPRLCVFFFLFIGMIFWVRLVSETHDPGTAILSLLIWITNSFVYEYAQQTMLEIPTLSLSIVCVYCLYRYVSTPCLKYAVLLGITAGLTLWTNQKSGFILPLILMYPLLKKKTGLLIARNTWMAYAVILVFLIPLAGITLWLGDQNLAQSLGTHSASPWYAKLDLFKNIYFLYHFHFSAPLLLLIAAGMFFSFRKGEKTDSLIFAAAIFSVYLFFTVIKVKIDRYPMYWIPFFCLFAAVGLQKLTHKLENLLKGKKPFIRYAIYSLPIIFQISFFPRAFIGYASGYEEAAAYVLKQTKSPVIFFDGYANGQFIFFARIHDPERKSVIVRGDKLISSSSIFYDNKLKIHLHTREEIDKALSELGIQFIVVESLNTSNIEIYDTLRELLQDKSCFRLHKAIPVSSNYNDLKMQKLLIYENLRYKGVTGDHILNLNLPVVGQQIKFKLEEILR